MSQQSRFFVRFVSTTKKTSPFGKQNIVKIFNIPNSCGTTNGFRCHSHLLEENLAERFDTNTLLVIITLCVAVCICGKNFIDVLLELYLVLHDSIVHGFQVGFAISGEVEGNFRVRSELVAKTVVAICEKAQDVAVVCGNLNTIAAREVCDLKSNAR